MLTSFASFKFWAGYMRKALMATCAPWYSPRQMSVNPPDATTMLPRFSSPAESTADAGSRSIVPHTFPKAVMNFVFCGSTVGYAFAEMMELRFQQRRTNDPGLPDLPCRQILSDLLVSILGCFAVVLCY